MPDTLTKRDMTIIAIALNLLSREGHMVIGGEIVNDVDAEIQQTWARVKALVDPPALRAVK